MKISRPVDGNVKIVIFSNYFDMGENEQISGFYRKVKVIRWHQCNKILFDLTRTQSLHFFFFCVFVPTFDIQTAINTTINTRSTIKMKENRKKCCQNHD